MKKNPYLPQWALDHKKRKSKQKDHIKTKGDVTKAIMEDKPSSVFINNVSSTMSVVPFTYVKLSEITYSTNDNTMYARKSKNIRVGHMAFRIRLNVQDTPGNLCRLMVVRLKDTSQSPAAFDPANIFQFNDGYGTQPDNLFSGCNLNYVDVKYDKIFNLQNTSAAAPATRMQDIYLSFKIKCHETWKFMTTASGSAVPSRNGKNYYLVALSDSATGTAHPRITGSTAVWFKNISK